jgi:hypothetical protein
VTLWVGRGSLAAIAVLADRAQTTKSDIHREALRLGLAAIRRDGLMLLTGEKREQ